MKIIDLLNKIANGEEVPKEIKYDNIDYFWCNQCKIYERIEDDAKDLYNDIDNLNDEVEILEEEKKIPENNFNYIYSCEDEHIMANFENIKTTLKDIIDYLKSKGE